MRPDSIIYKFSFLAVFSLNVLVSCQTQSLPFIAASEIQGVKEVRLGTSAYYFLLPGNFETSEARGKEGQLGYNIIPKDSSSTLFGFIEIRRGRPIGGNLSGDSDAKPFAESLLAGKKIKWKIARTETGYYKAFTSEKGDLNAQVSSKVRAEIDHLISIIATLKHE